MSTQHCEHNKEHAPETGPLNLRALRQSLNGRQNRDYWRSLEQLAETPEFVESLHREFPRGAAEWDASTDRRQFLQLMAASLALAGVTGCTAQPDEKIVPYVRAPEGVTPGQPLFFASAMPLGGYAQGVLVKSLLGRPIKIEGNPLHPASLGATDAFTQASILSLYDPDRSQTVLHQGQISTWDRFLTALQTQLESLRATRGAGLWILTETVTSPTLASQIEQIERDFPEARWAQYQPVGRDNSRLGARRAFGRSVDTVYRFDRAEIVLSLDANFLADMPGSLRYAHDFIDRRRGTDAEPSMNRLYVVEPTPSITGMIADHRQRLGSRQIGLLARWLAGQLGIEQTQAAPDAQALGLPEAWLSALLEDLRRQSGKSLVIAGESLRAEFHVLAHAINAKLGGPGATLEYFEPVEPHPDDHIASLWGLTRDLQAGAVKTLIILGGNPVYTAAADFNFGESLAAALGGGQPQSGQAPHAQSRTLDLCVHLSDYVDETSALADWHLPAAHYLESWADLRAFDGTVTIAQPLIAPLYRGKSAYEILAAVAGRSEKSTYDIVQSYWQELLGEYGFADAWRKAIHDGIMSERQYRAINPSLQTSGKLDADTTGNNGFVEKVDVNARAFRNQATPGSAMGDSVEVIFRVDPSVWDGRFANNGWLQELPKPLTKLTWDNAALISPATAERLSLASQDVARLSHGGASIEVPILIMPGQADDTLTLFLGYGRTRAGHVGSGLGYNAYALRGADSQWALSGVAIEKLAKTYPLVITQDHHSMEGRNLVRSATLAEYHEDPLCFQTDHHALDEQPTLYPPQPNDGAAWGMVINQNACIGCNACVVACQAENNIPIVGKQQVSRGREMHWLRIDRYYRGDIDEPETYMQPMLCMHCETAPCEVVCPVAATVHSTDGLNQMIYNRCVGTRYCSNNCPYKVRRFNFLQYSDIETPSLKLLHNPDVTVRNRGVMEKCSYCVQRISAGRIAAKVENRPIRDGEVVTACQAACPTRAIAFGDIQDEQSAVRLLKQSPLNYGLLAELGTRPRTTYLGRLRNPHPSLTEPATADTPDGERLFEQGDAGESL